MKKRNTRLELGEIRNKIRRLIGAGATPNDIQQTLTMPESTFYWHMSAIYQEDKKILEKEATEYLHHEILVAKERLQRGIQTCETIANDKNQQARDRIEAERLKKELTINIVQLMRDGPSQVIGEHNRGDKQESIPKSVTHFLNSIK